MQEPSIITDDGTWVYVGDRETKCIRRFNISTGQMEAGEPWLDGLPISPEFLVPAQGSTAQDH